MAEKLRDAARQLFAERGFSATTTREIARRADVNESLLFRHFRDKESLFDEVISAPFEQLIENLAAERMKLTVEERLAVDKRETIRSTVELFRKNRELFSGILLLPRMRAAAGEPARHKGLETYFTEVMRQVEWAFEVEQYKIPPDLETAIRLSFGLIASSVLYRDWLFPLGTPSDKVIDEAVIMMIMRALDLPRHWLEVRDGAA